MHHHKHDRNPAQDPFSYAPVPARYLWNVLRIYEDHGFSKNELLKTFDISEDWLSDAGHLVNRQIYYKVIDKLLTENSVPGLGLLQGKRNNLADFGIIGITMASANNFMEAAEVPINYPALTGANTGFHLDFSPYKMNIVCHEPPPGLRYCWALETLISGWTVVIQKCTGNNNYLKEVHLSYPDPGYSELYEEVLNCRVHFDQTRCEIRLHPTIKDAFLPGANADLFKLCIIQCNKTVLDSHSSANIINQIEAIISAYPNRFLKQEAVADYLSMSKRTLQRKLKTLGTSYSEIADRFRMEVAEDYLMKTSLDPKKIAYRLGYSNLSNFYHAFKRWFNCTPKEYRQRHKQML